MSAVLHLDLLGGYRASAGPDGLPIDFPTKKSALLLVPIVIEQPAPSRDRLAALFWSNRQEQQGRGSLRQAIFTMRTTLRGAGAPAPVTQQDRVFMPPETAVCDVVDFRNAAQGSTIEDLENARRLYKGPFLGTVRLPDPEFAAWVEETRETLLRAAEAVGVDLAALYREAGNHSAAIDALDWVLSLDPIREDVHRSLMRLHLEAGNRTLALRQYRNCVSVLERELGVNPDFETQALFQAISIGASTTSAGTVPAPSVAARQPAEQPRSPSAKTEAKPPSPSHPMVAVLPFSLLSDAAEAAQLGEGLFEDLTSDLPKFHQIKCKARNAALSAIESGIPRNKIGASVMANYVVDGSIRISGNRVRVNAQLVEVASGVQLWSDRYTVDMEDIFDTQDRLTQRIVVAVTNQLKHEMLTLAQRKTSAEMTPYDCWLTGFSLVLNGTEDHTRRAKKLFERALELDPYYARGHCGMSLAYFNEWGAHAWPNWNEAIEKAYAHADEAVRLSEADHVGQTLLGRAHIYRREYDRGQRYLERSYALNPYGTDMLATAALSWSFLGDHRRAHDLASRAIELHPSPPDWYYGGIALSLFMTGKAAEARKIRERSPKAYPDTLAFLAADYAMEGDMARARTYAARFHEDFSTQVLGGRQPVEGEILEWIRHANPFRLEKDARLMEEAMSAAGVGKAV
ncbi:hypothetical protein EOI86_01725 [Hwanghaeella grinnelliae]|uniref:Bacterial transcriptional activator domain-containing protein n=1 Tax=Hwanghaeella grinnelliae TaxID=2500179 RepID=A0A437QU79_9PROT|nr:BTAD domain-containing putative transcriptional regulator [Hwanghaeella grinnelliae]RVU38049.1 hypothetical protein EOI86_01725 [Hwanghaeella grinnelliae]